MARGEQAGGWRQLAGWRLATASRHHHAGRCLVTLWLRTVRGSCQYQLCYRQDASWLPTRTASACAHLCSRRWCAGSAVFSYSVYSAECLARYAGRYHHVCDGASPPPSPR